MIRINLLRSIKESKEPEKKIKRKRKKSGFKTVFYVGLLIIAVGLAIYTYFPELFDFSFLEQKPKLSIPVEIPEVVAPTEDTTQQVAVKEEEPPPPKPKPPVKREKTDDYISKAYLETLRDINGFSVVKGAVSEGLGYTLITISEGNFISEIVADSKDRIAQYSIDLKKKLPGGGIKIIGVNEIVETDKLIANIWGYFDFREDLKGKAFYKDFLEPSKVISQIRMIAKRSGFIIKSYVINEAVRQADYQKFPVLLKFQGYDGNAIKFVESLKVENLNFVVQKISAVPELEKNRILIAVNLEVFVPSQ